MVENKPLKYHSHNDYWEKNIEAFTGFYDKTSEEKISGNSVIQYLYKKLIFPIERQVTRHRFDMVTAQISATVTKKSTVVDLGCGGGVFSLYLAKNGINVIACDFADSALELTEKKIPKTLQKKVKIRKLDITKARTPNSDLTIAVGVLPYISDLKLFVRNIGLGSDAVLFNYLEGTNPFNVIRRKLTFLDVRNYEYQSRHDVESDLKACGFSHLEFKKLGTGFMVYAKKTKFEIDIFPQGL